MTRFVPQGEVLFEVNSIGYEFFIILKGLVGIFINLPNAFSEERRKQILESETITSQPKEMARFKSKFKGVPVSPENLNTEVINKVDGGYHLLYKTYLQKDVNTLGQGFSFGEAALISGKSQLRNATIFCKTDCYFAVLDKTNYERIIGEQAEKEINSKVNFLKSVPIFSFFPDLTIRTMIYEISTMNFSYRQDIFEQGQCLDSIYIVKYGKVKV